MTSSVRSYDQLPARTPPPTDPQGSAVFFVGTSSVGKRAIAKELITYCPRASYTTCTEALDAYIWENLAARCPNEMHVVVDHFKTVRRVYDALIAVRLQAKISCSDQVLQALKKLNQARKEFKLPEVEECAKRVVSFCRKTLRSGSSCICGLESLNGVDVGERDYKVLVYCPVSALVQRILKRNEEAMRTGQYSDLRRGTSCLSHYGLLFRPVKGNEPPLFTLTRKELAAGVEQLVEDWNGKMHEKNRLDLDATVRQVFESFSFPASGVDFLRFVPIKKYDEIINSSQYTAGAAASVIFNAISPTS